MILLFRSFLGSINKFLRRDIYQSCETHLRSHAKSDRHLLPLSFMFKSVNIRKRILTKTWTVREIQKVNLGKSKEDQMLTFVRSNINIQIEQFSDHDKFVGSFETCLDTRSKA